RSRHTRFSRDWSSDVCSSDLAALANVGRLAAWSLGAAVARLGARAIPQIAAVMSAKPMKAHASVLAQLRTPRLALIAIAFHEDRSEERRVGEEEEYTGEACSV